MLVRTANREDPDQTASSEADYLPWPFIADKLNSFQNF